MAAFMGSAPAELSRTSSSSSASAPAASATESASTRASLNLVEASDWICPRALSVLSDGHAATARRASAPAALAAATASRPAPAATREALAPEAATAATASAEGERPRRSVRFSELPGSPERRRVAGSSGGRRRSPSPCASRAVRDKMALSSEHYPWLLPQPRLAGFGAGGSLASSSASTAASSSALPAATSSSSSSVAAASARASVPPRITEGVGVSYVRIEPVNDAPFISGSGGGLSNGALDELPPPAQGSYKPAARGSEIKASWRRFQTKRKLEHELHRQRFLKRSHRLGGPRRILRIHGEARQQHGVHHLTHVGARGGGAINMTDGSDVTGVLAGPVPGHTDGSLVTAAAPAATAGGWSPSHDVAGSAVSQTALASPPAPLFAPLPPVMLVGDAALLGAVAAVAVEVAQAVALQESGNGALQTVVESSGRMRQSLARGASMGAAAATLSFLVCPLAPTALFVGYSVGQECSIHHKRWKRRAISKQVAARRSLDSVLGAVGGVAAAWAAASVLAGTSGVVVAAGAACSGLAGNVGGRRISSIAAGFPEFRRLYEDPKLRDAYIELGVLPGCSDLELRRAFHRAVLRNRSGDASVSDGAPSCVADVEDGLERVNQAMADVRRARGQEYRPLRYQAAHAGPEAIRGQRASAPSVVGKVAEPVTVAVAGADEAAAKRGSVVGLRSALKSSARPLPERAKPPAGVVDFVW
eukprot:TRINITY_DN10776_c0_g1_i1.p1 TRINITY_DN10776_c0_g1~~TRINITY_DN10776_c0_g1_i1.p1  ORF type:complete len:709 (+),score=155.66 TRINITY_DN10776_c0_g1_i1:68-2194(+)